MGIKKIKVTRNLEGTITDIKEYRKSAPQKTVDNSWYWERVKPRDRLFYKEAELRGDIEFMETLKNRYGKT